jgi:hypothetical protein
MSSYVYDGFIEGFARAELDWVGDTFRVVLVGDGYEPDPTHSTRADLGNYELGSSAGYDRGGELLRNRRLEPVDPAGLRLVGGEVTWTHFTGRFRYAVVCQDNGSRSNDRLISVTDLGGQSFTDASVTVSYDREGVCVFQPEVSGRG